MSTPYTDLPNYCFWRRSVSNIPRRDFDPVTKVKFSISKTDKVATAGSCFAQHISRKLNEIGFNFFVTEKDNTETLEGLIRRNFGVFSARFGNIYTVQQLNQLFEEAFEGRIPRERFWSRSDGKIVDPLRPTIEPDGFDSIEHLLNSRYTHLNCVREMFEQSNVLVFTLGLTEAWRARDDGSVYPLAPGVSGGSFDHDLHEFVNFTASEIETQLDLLVARLKRVNPRLRLILTVSPVPLVATYEQRSVLLSTIYSKSSLRVAAEAIYRKYDHVDYFPSYEIIVGSFNFGMYYEDDAREVNSIGVNHVMRLFVEHYTGAPQIEVAQPSNTKIAKISTTEKPFSGVVCDEEEIDRMTSYLP